MIYRLAALAAVLALIVGMVLLTAPQPESVARASTGQPLHDPGYSAQQARLVQTGADGRPVYTLDAAQIQQQPGLSARMSHARPILNARDAPSSSR